MKLCIIVQDRQVEVPFDRELKHWVDVSGGLARFFIGPEKYDEETAKEIAAFDKDAVLGYYLSYEE